MIKLNYVEHIDYGYIRKEILLDPELYSDCENRDEVIDMIWDDIDQYISHGDVHIKDSDADIDITDEFWDEWEKFRKK